LLPLAVGSELGKSSASPLENRKPHGFGSDASTFSSHIIEPLCVGWRRAAGTCDRLCPQVPLKKWLAIAHANPAESLAGYSLHGSAEVARAVYTNGTGLMYIYLHVSG